MYRTTRNACVTLIKRNFSEYINSKFLCFCSTICSDLFSARVWRIARIERNLQLGVFLAFSLKPAICWATVCVPLVCARFLLPRRMRGMTPLAGRSSAGTASAGGTWLPRRGTCTPWWVSSQHWAAANTPALPACQESLKTNARKVFSSLNMIGKKSPIGN